MAQRPTPGFSVGNHCLVALLLCSSLLVRVDCWKSNNEWSLEQLARDFCKTVAGIKHTHCTCVDTEITAGQGNNLCGYPQSLGPGLDVLGTSVTGFPDNFPLPDAHTLEKECDARNSDTSLVGCNIAESRIIRSEPEITTIVSLGLNIRMQFSLPGLAVPFTFTFQDSTSITSEPTIFTSSNTCGPISSGQPAGTCALYKDIYQSHTLQGQKFTYDATVRGGVQMRFSNAIDAPDALGQRGDGSKHHYWWFTIAEIVSFGQSAAGNLVNINQFDTPHPKHLDNSVTFHGVGYLSGHFVDRSSTCSAYPCIDETLVSVD